MRYEYKRRVVSAEYWDGSQEAKTSIERTYRKMVTIHDNKTITIHSPRGELTAYVGDYLVKDGSGVVFPVPHTVFWMAFERHYMGGT